MHLVHIYPSIAVNVYFFLKKTAILNLTLRVNTRVGRDG